MVKWFFSKIQNWNHDFVEVDSPPYINFLDWQCSTWGRVSLLWALDAASFEALATIVSPFMLLQCFGLFIILIFIYQKKKSWNLDSECFGQLSNLNFKVLSASDPKFHKCNPIIIGRTTQDDMLPSLYLLKVSNEEISVRTPS